MLGDVMNLSVIDDIAIQGGGVSADYLERLILDCADARIAAGDMRAGMVLERVARKIAAEWSRLETIDDDLEAARKELRAKIEDAAALLEEWLLEEWEWAPDTAYTDLAYRSRAWLRNRHK